MKRQKNDTKLTYPLVQSASKYTNSPMESAVDPSVRIAAMTVASYYNENRDKYETQSGNPEENITPTIASEMLDYLDSSVTPVVNSFQNIAGKFGEQYSFLPWLQKMYNMYPKVVDVYEKGVKNITSITNDGTALGYLNMMYGYIEEILDMLSSFTEILFLDNSDAIRQMTCCMLFYFDSDLTFNESLGENAAAKIDEVIKGIEAIEESISSMESTLNSGIGFINSVSSMINNILKTILQTAVYGVIAILAKSYGDLMDKLEPKLDFKICGKSIIDYLDFSGKMNYEMAAVLETTLREKIDGLKSSAKVSEVRGFQFAESLNRYGLDTKTLTDLVLKAGIGKIQDIKPPENFEDTEEERNAICNACIPLYDLVGKSINIGVTSIVTWLSNLTKQLMTLVPEIPTIPKSKFKVLSVIKTIKNILVRIKLALPASAEIENCKKQIRSVVERKELPDNDIVNPNPIPSQAGKALKSIGYTSDVEKLPQDFLNYIKDRGDISSPSINPKEIIDAISEDKSKPENPKIDIPEKVLEDIIKTPTYITRQIMEIQYDVIKRTRDRISSVVDEIPEITVSIEPITRMIRITVDGEIIVTDIPSSSVTPDVVYSIINIDPETLKIISSLTHEQLRELLPQINYSQFTVTDESISSLIAAISENPDAFTGLINSEKDPQELLNMMFKTAQKTSKTLAESRSALSRYFDNVNEAIDYLTRG